MSDRSFTDIARSPFTWLAIVVAVGVGSALYIQSQREQTRQRIEAEKIAADKAEQARVKEAEVRREREKQAMLDEIRAVKAAEDQARLAAMESRKEDTLNKQFVADERPVQRSSLENAQMAQDMYRGEYERRRQQYEDRENLYRAQQEVERQKRYVQQREYEEQRVRQQRDFKAKYGN